MNFKSLQLGANTSLLIIIGTLTINTFLPMRNKFVYSCSIKIRALGFDKLLESVFCLLLVVEAFSLQTAVKMPEEVAVGWQESRWTRRPRRTFRHVQPVSAAVPRAPGGAVPENRALSADQRRLQVVEFLVRLIDLLSVLLVMISSGFRKLQWIRQAADHQTVTMTFLGGKFGLGKCFGASSWSNH